MRFALGCVAALIACICGAGLLAHLRPIMGAEWLREVLPFGLATRPLRLFAMLIASGFAAWWLTRRPEER